MLRYFIYILLAVLLSACSSGETQAACNVPVEIKVYRTATSQITREERYVGGQMQVVATGPAALTAEYTCEGIGIQYLQFDLQAYNWFSSAWWAGLTSAGDHVAILTRANANMQVPVYEARGPILHSTWGVLGEYYNRNGITISNLCQNGPSSVNSIPCGGAPFISSHPMQLTDHSSEVYSVWMHSTPELVSYSVKKNNSEEAASVWKESNTSAALYGQKILFGFVCKTGCEQNQFTVHMRNISAGWF